MKDKTVYGYGISEKLALFDAEEKMSYALDDLAKYEKPLIISSHTVEDFEVPTGRVPQQFTLWEVKVQYVVKDGIVVRDLHPVERN